VSSRSLIRLGLGAALLCAVSIVGAVPIVDQVQSSRAQKIGAFTQIDLFQSFVQTGDNIVGAGIWLFTDNSNAGGEIVIDLYDALPTSPGAKKLASGKETGKAGEFVEILFDGGPVDLKQGQTYFLAFTSKNPNLSIGGGGLPPESPNPYPNGLAYGSGFPFPDLDYAFATFAEVRVAVPEPGTFTLLAIALLGVGFTRRRPKN
jgi:PEP-CTERM motif